MQNKNKNQLLASAAEVAFQLTEDKLRALAMVLSTGSSYLNQQAAYRQYLIAKQGAIVINSAAETEASIAQYLTSVETTLEDALETASTKHSMAISLPTSFPLTLSELNKFLADGTWAKENPEEVLQAHILAFETSFSLMSGYFSHYSALKKDVEALRNWYVSNVLSAAS